MLGALKQIIYYKLFHFSIVPYLEFTESLTFFLNDFALFGGMVLIQNLLGFLFVPKSEEESIGMGLNEALKEKNFFNRLNAYAVNGINLYLILIVWLIGFPFWIWLSNKPWTYYFIFLAVIAFILIFLTLIYELRRQWFIKFDEHPKLIYTNLFRIFLILLLFTISNAYIEHDTVAEEKKYFGTWISTDRDSILSDSNYYFIGQTRNFVFFHNQLDCSTTAFSRADIKSLTIKESLSKRKP